MRIIKFFLLIAILIITVQCSLSQGISRKGSNTYTVKQGDTLYSISRRFDISLEELKKQNNITDERSIAVGTTLIISKKNEYNTNEQNVITSSDTYFIYPVKGKLLSKFGYRRFSRRSRRLSFHNGIDIKGKIGTPIVASKDGIVTFSGRKRGYGYVVIIKHSDNFKTAYGHNRINLVRKGQKIKQGQKIAEVGMTGRTTGSHVHFEIRLNNRPVDPLNYLNRNIANR